MLDEFIWDVRNFDADVLRVGHGRVKVEILEINGAKSSTLSRENTV